MTAKRLDDRLYAVASRVRQGSRVADVGTDHGYIPIYLLKCGICPLAIATDVREGPLGSAAANVAQAGLQDSIFLRLGDGLAPVSADEVDDIIIAGMGGELIAAIMGRCGWVKNSDKLYILQPMSCEDRLRLYLAENGFDIAEERAVRCQSHVYTVITARFSGIVREYDEAYYYIGGLLHDRSDAAAAYRRKVLRRLNKQLNGTVSRGDTEAGRQISKIIEDVIRGAENEGG